MPQIAHTANLWSLVDHPNYVERLLCHPELIQNSEQCHFRPFNGQHCQIAVTQKGRLTAEVKSYLSFAKAVMDLWRSAPRNRDKTLFACPEMGPYADDGSGYNITGLPPAWPDAVVLREKLAMAWTKGIPDEK